MFTATIALIAAQATGTDEPAPAPAPPRCEGAQFEAFDFWVGEWTVTPASGSEPIADSKIEKVSAGCAIRERWMPYRGGHGTSLSAYDPQTGNWHQLWVGAQPGRVFFDGGPHEGKMVLTGYWGKDAQGNAQLVRMTYSVQSDGSVRQHGQSSIDHGLSWSDSFDLIYRRKDASE
ncbi:hypothetical protein [Qipengyuania psychrotolerans]|uniref:DUF1579 domain-containing protein n=1 Tax=Qipengyuania psychrotolerans TaxID=2867238 RepID=A0ABX8ZGJ3_9SPHN|nr:hypothetical protein [Qipengyuania psychrotolerans]QZD88130.1 hypothetical protein K3166_05510 [Qipengyuania psychrotolerans]